MDRHAVNPGFRCLVAAADGAIAGFSYGFHGQSGQWWHDMVAGALAVDPGAGYSNQAAQEGRTAGLTAGLTAGRTSGRAAGRTATAWLDDSFEVAELHVLPPYQGMGIGRGLLLSLTSGRGERTAVLSTADAPTRARRLYRGVGFTDLLTGFRFSGSEPPYAIMGARLPLRVKASQPSRGLGHGDRLGGPVHGQAELLVDLDGR
jgi:ribosomal protein S18 acetylase RimI-like enzyme